MATPETVTEAPEKVLTLREHAEKIQAAQDALNRAIVDATGEHPKAKVEVHIMETNEVGRYASPLVYVSVWEEVL
jgi:hypothetical protein